MAEIENGAAGKAAPASSAPAKVLDACIIARGADDNPASANLRRRRAASWRLPPLACGCRDPLDCLRPGPVCVASSYSLPRRELSRHIRSLRQAGWQSWEVAVRFDFGRPGHAA